MKFPVRRLVLSYAVAAGGVLLAGLSHWWLAPILQDTPPMRLLLVIVVMAAAWLGGLWPGLFASLLGILAIVAANDAPETSRAWEIGSFDSGLSHSCSPGCSPGSTPSGTGPT